MPDSALRASKAVAEKAIAAFDGAGIFGVEMFLLADGSVLLNEVAPRPHNSGHYTQDGCATSQFENHVRAVMGWPLGDTSLTVGSSIMLNLLGEADGEQGIKMGGCRQHLSYASNIEVWCPTDCNTHTARRSKKPYQNSTNLRPVGEAHD